MDTVVWIIIAIVVAILLIGAVVFIARQNRTKRRRVEAVRIREQVRDETVKVERREALAEETAARARAARAEAEAKAAEAARLEDRATAHQSGVTAHREELDKQRQYADRLDPSARDDGVHEGKHERVDEVARPAATDQTVEEPTTYTRRDTT
jgi:DNA anti-recombination protein RmuC